MMTPIVCTVAVFRKATGELVHLTTPALAPAPTDPDLQAITLPNGFDDQTWVWDATKRQFLESPAKVEAALLASVKDTAETRKMAFLSPGGAKKAEYAQKAAEVAFWDSLGGTASAALTALGLLSPATRQAKFGFAIADAAAFSEPNISGAIERFRLGMSSSTKVPAIAAAEAKACAAIKAATTASAKREAAAAISWPA